MAVDNDKGYTFIVHTEHDKFALSVGENDMRIAANGRIVARLKRPDITNATKTKIAPPLNNPLLIGPSLKIANAKRHLDYLKQIIKGFFEIHSSRTHHQPR